MKISSHRTRSVFDGCDISKETDLAEAAKNWNPEKLGANWPRGMQK
jgi:hypothetical protein